MPMRPLLATPVSCDKNLSVLLAFPSPGQQLQRAGTENACRRKLSASADACVLPAVAHAHQLPGLATARSKLGVWR
jgi:hypothetical protein